MSKTNLLIVFCTVFFFSQCSTDSKKTVVSEAERQELLTTIESFNTAFRNGDARTLNTMITDEYLHTNGNSKAIDKKSWITYMEHRSGSLARGNFEVSDYAMDEIDIAFYGDAALVTGKVSVTRKDATGIKTNNYRVTHLWIKEAGKWKRAGFHDGKIK